MGESKTETELIGTKMCPREHVEDTCAHLSQERFPGLSGTLP